MSKNILTNSELVNKINKVNPQNALDVLRKVMLIDGFEIVLDLEKSHGLTINDAKTNDEYLDFYSFFASAPLGMNHPKLNTKEFKEELTLAAMNKPSNSDIYTVEMAKFVDTLCRLAMPEYFKHLFFVEGGTLAVENGLKAAFDWKVKKNFMKGYKEEKGQQVIHFRQAFHGRSGYTLSLTNTDPIKTAHYPKFNWPRITNPKIIFPLEENLDKIIQLENQAINEIYSAIKNNQDDIAAIIIEPIQGEGGDNFFRKEFFLKLREIADEHDIMLMFDEVQTGVGLTGKMWAHEYFVQPDIMSFGKKVQVCGIMVSNRIDEVEDNVLRVSGRINSTWGGNLTDMVRARKYLEVIVEDNLIENARIVGQYLLEKLLEVQKDFPHLVSQARGLGLMCAFDMPTPEIRKRFLTKLFENKMLMLGCGVSTVRFRPPLIITKEEVDKGIEIIRRTLRSI